MQITFAVNLEGSPVLWKGSKYGQYQEEEEADEEMYSS